MPRIRVQLLPDTISEDTAVFSSEFPLQDGITVTQVVQWIAQAPLSSQPVGAAASSTPVTTQEDADVGNLRVINHIDRAFAKIGNDAVKYTDLTEQMRLDGWQTKAARPEEVVAATLRDSKNRIDGPRYESLGNGYWFQVKPGSVGQPRVKRKPPVQPEPGQSLSALAERVLQAVGSAKLEDIYELMVSEGFETHAEKPLNSLSSALYRKKGKFRYADGLWHLITE